MWVVIWAFILSIVPLLVVRIVVMLGLSIVTYTGISLVLDELRDALLGLYDNIGTDAIQPAHFELSPFGGSAVFTRKFVS